MKSRSRKSIVDFIVCPRCEIGKLEQREPGLAGCTVCRRTVHIDVLTALRRIVGLPDARGGHACECGHPQMRRLPDDVFWCPACGSEVLPVVSRRASPNRES